MLRGGYGSTAAVKRKAAKEEGVWWWSAVMEVLTVGFGGFRSSFGSVLL